jgi:dolichol-phosphate mannosyltransferase
MTDEVIEMHVALVIPVLDEAASLGQLLSEVTEALDGRKLIYKVFVVDDGSTDGSADVALSFGAEVLRSARNMGKSAALQAGFDATRGFDVVVTMDGDLQDDPSELPRMIDELAGADLVNGRKVDRRDSWLKRAQSRLFGWFVRVVTDLDLRDINSGYKAYRREVLDSIELTGDQHRLIPLIAYNSGFSVKEIDVNHRPREHGKSRYGVGRAFRGPMDLVTVLFLSKYGQRPLHFLGGTGLAVALAGLVLGMYLTYLKVFQGEAIGDRPLLLLAVLLMLTGMQLFVSGLIGEMILKSRRTRPASPYRLYVDSGAKTVSPAEVDRDPAQL